MDVKYVTPFIVGFNNVMKQLGFAKIRKGVLQAKKRTFKGTGLIVVVGMAGQLKGNVVYTIDNESARKIAAVMMKADLKEALEEDLDDIAKSSIGELANMLTAHAATAFSAMKIHMEISTPACFEGNNIDITMSSDKVLCIQMLVDDIPINVNIAFEK